MGPVPRLLLTRSLNEHPLCLPAHRRGALGVQHIRIMYNTRTFPSSNDAILGAAKVARRHITGSDVVALNQQLAETGTVHFALSHFRHVVTVWKDSSTTWCCGWRDAVPTPPIDVLLD